VLANCWIEAVARFVAVGDQAVSEVDRLVAEAVKQGATMELGGRAPSGPGSC